MDHIALSFIENATLLFVASRNADGALDVSPRGGQPRVMRPGPSETLLLPDYRGNRRLDTIGNIQARPEVALIVLNRMCDHYLRISARAELSFSDEHLRAFPADDNPPVSVLLLSDVKTMFVDSAAFERAGFWIPPGARKPPLDLGALVRADKANLATMGRSPILKNEDEERLLANTGIRRIYGTSGEGVKTKVADIAGPGVLSFLAEAGFVVLAQAGATGDIQLDLVGGAPPAPETGSNTGDISLQLPDDVAAAPTGECALLTVAPGRSEALRLNGRHERRDSPGRHLRIRPREIFFHCSAAFSRSRVWIDDRRQGWSGRRSFICTERRRESSDVASFVLCPRDDAPVDPVAPGQYVSVSLPDDPTSPPRRRSYSVSGGASKQDLRITVRRIGKGGLSDLLHDTVDAGSEILLGAPAGSFVLDSAPGRTVVLVSAGVGITPLLPMLDSLALDGSERDVWFVHAARDSRHHLFQDEALQTAARATHTRIRTFTAYSRPAAGEESDHTGRIDAHTIADLTPVHETDYYLCGPGDFMATLRDGLITLGAAPGSVRFEAFGTDRQFPSDIYADRGPRKVTFARSERTETWTSASGTLLDLALAAGIDAPYSCRMGDCQSCVQRLAGGHVDHLIDDDLGLGEDQILMCQAIPADDVVIDC